MAYPVGFDSSGSKVVSTPREMVMNVPVVNREIFEIFRHKLIFDFVVEGKTLKIVKVR